MTPGEILDVLLFEHDFGDANGLIVMPTQEKADAELARVGPPLSHRLRTKAVGVGAPLCGYAADIVVLALEHHEDAVLRLRQEEWIRDVVRCRLAPHGIWVEVLP